MSADMCPDCGHAWALHENLVACSAIVGKHKDSKHFEGATIRCLCESMPPSYSSACTHSATFLSSPRSMNSASCEAGTRRTACDSQPMSIGVPPTRRAR